MSFQSPRPTTVKTRFWDREVRDKGTRRSQRSAKRSGREERADSGLSMSSQRYFGVICMRVLCVYMYEHAFMCTYTHMHVLHPLITLVYRLIYIPSCAVSFKGKACTPSQLKSRKSSNIPLEGNCGSTKSFDQCCVFTYFCRGP